MADAKDGSDLRSLTEHLVGRIEALQVEVDQLKVASPASGPTAGRDPGARRSLPTDGNPVDMAVLAEWVHSLQVRYATETDWLRPCWWRHGFVIEELAALREAWLAANDTDEPTGRALRLRWHEEAERCRERIRRTIAIGTGCSAVFHVPDDPITDDAHWTEGLSALSQQFSSGGNPGSAPVDQPDLGDPPQPADLINWREGHQ